MILTNYFPNLLIFQVVSQLPIIMNNDILKISAWGTSDTTGKVHEL